MENSEKIVPFNSYEYWEKRYASNKTSGSGSYGILSEYKSSIVNLIIHDYDIKNLVEFGCGDGNQLKLFEIGRYTGYDVSKTIINKCKRIFENDSSKSFYLLKEYNGEMFDLSISLDVIYHLVEDEVFLSYMKYLFDSSKKIVLIYSSNGDHNFPTSIHLRDRNFTEWVKENRSDFDLIKKIENPYKFNPISPNNTSISNFYLYKRNK